MEITRTGPDGRRIWQALDKHKQWIRRPLVFRGSGLPFCARRFCLDRKVEPLSESSYVRDVRLHRGHAVHYAVQKWLGDVGLLFGNWVCESCQRSMGPTYRVRDTFGPVGQCPRHGHALTYEEYDLCYEDLTGHPDGLLLRSKDPLTFSLLEAKTIQHTAPSPKSKSFMNLKEPDHRHVEQANAYACMIPKLLGFAVARCVIMYISVDKPNWRPKFFEFTPDFSRFARNIRTVRYIKRCLDKPDVIPQRCSDQDCDPFCEYHEPCRSDRLDLLGVPLP